MRVLIRDKGTHRAGVRKAKIGGALKDSSTDIFSMQNGLAPAMTSTFRKSSLPNSVNERIGTLTQAPILQYGGSLHTGLNKLNFNKKEKSKNIKFTL